MKKIVIIGGGFAGAYCAKSLQQEFNVTLIDTKDYFEFTPSILRTLVEPEHRTKIEVQHKEYLRQGHFVQAEVISLTKKVVRTTSGNYRFDYLVICSGSRYNTPIKEKNLLITSRSSELQKYAQHLKEAQSVLIIGGGVVGTELAAEIVCAFPEKKVTIVHANSELLERNPQRARRYAQRFLENKGVAILLNERVIMSVKGKFKTNKEGEFHPDLAFLCTGIVPNGEFLPYNYSESLNEKKFLKVNDFMQMKGSMNIFAAGDITTIAEEKLAQSAEKQAEIVVRNIEHLENGEKLERYISKPRVMVISLGKWKGILVYKNFVLTGIIAGMLKQMIEWKTMKRYK